jgi:hypothetical protein
MPQTTAPVPSEQKTAQRRQWSEDESDDDYGDHDVRRRRRHDLEPHRGTMILVLGILSIVFTGLGFILGPIAWIMGSNDLTAIRAGRMDPDGEGTTSAGRICGIIGTILGSLSLICCLLYFAMFIIIGVTANAPPRKF